MNIKLLMKISLMIDKMGIANEIAEIDAENVKDAGTKLISLIISKIYKVEKEMIDFIAEYKNISCEEAEKVNIVAVLKELFSEEGFKSFLQQQ